MANSWQPWKHLEEVMTRMLENNKPYSDGYELAIICMRLDRHTELQGIEINGLECEVDYLRALIKTNCPELLETK